jgi:hypothetical protein
MTPGESKCIDTGLKIAIGDKSTLIAQSTDTMYFKTKLEVKHHAFFKEGTESTHNTETFKFILHNYEMPIMFPVKSPGDRPVHMQSNKVKLINGEEATIPAQLVPVNSYFIKKNDIIASIIIAKLEE